MHKNIKTKCYYLQFAKKAVAISAVFLCMVGLAIVSNHTVKNGVYTAAKQQNIKTVIVDAGHGGFDGGAVEGQTIEKDINLSIALYLKDMLQLNGYKVITTRNNDSSIEDDSTKSIAARKKSDMLNRLALMQSNPSALFVSIHMNKYSTSGVRGAQVFYASNIEQSKPLANYIMHSIVQRVQPDNKRAIKKNYKTTYLLQHATIPAVIVECGFLSNKEELALLKDQKYQQKIAFAIYSGIEDYYNGSETNAKS